MRDINLLPVDLSPSRKVYKLAAVVKRVDMILLAVFLVVLVLGIGLVEYFKSQINSSVARQQVLTTNIQNLQSTEQKVFLIKDRVEKIQTVFNMPDRVAEFENINTVLNNLPDNVSVYSVAIDSSRTEFSVLSQDSLSMARFLDSLVASGYYKNFTLNGFVFSPDRGYLVTLDKM